MAFFAILMVKMVSPFIAGIGVIGGLFAKNRIQFALIPVAASLVNETLLTMTQAARDFDPLNFIVGIIAAGIWSAVAYLVKVKI